MDDYLDSARQALAGALARPGGGGSRDELMAIADTHARIAIAETLRAILGVLVAVPDDTEGIR